MYSAVCLFGYIDTYLLQLPMTHYAQIELHQASHFRTVQLYQVIVKYLAGNFL